MGKCADAHALDDSRLLRCLVPAGRVARPGRALRRRAQHRPGPPGGRRLDGGDRAGRGRPRVRRRARAVGVAGDLRRRSTCFATAGAVLVVLGVRRWREGAGEMEGVAAPASPRRIIAEGFVVQLLNPKVAVFFLAFFPQFLNPKAAVLPQTLVLGALYIAVAACSDLAYVVFASVIAERVKRSARAAYASRAGARSSTSGSARSPRPRANAPPSRARDVGVAGRRPCRRCGDRRAARSPRARGRQPQRQRPRGGWPRRGRWRRGRG